MHCRVKLRGKGTDQATLINSNWAGFWTRTLNVNMNITSLMLPTRIGLFLMVRQHPSMLVALRFVLAHSAISTQQNTTSFLSRLLATVHNTKAMPILARFPHKLNRYDSNYGVFFFVVAWVSKRARSGSSRSNIWGGGRGGLLARYAVSKLACC